MLLHPWIIDLPSDSEVKLLIVLLVFENPVTQKQVQKNCTLP